MQDTDMGKYEDSQWFNCVIDICYPIKHSMKNDKPKQEYQMKNNIITYQNMYLIARLNYIFRWSKG